MADLSKVLNETIGIDEERFEETIIQNSLLYNNYSADLLFASDFEEDGEDEVDDDDEFEDEDEDLFEEDELEEEGYEEDFDFDEEEEEDEDDEESFGQYN